MNSNEQKVLNSIQHIPVEQLMTLDFFKNRGEFFIERALTQDDQGKRELAFSNVIKRHVEDLQFFNDSENFHLKTALTVFQWLTTNVGNSVLEDALKATGRKIVGTKKTMME